MVVHIIIGGISQCNIFAEITLVADYLCKQLPNFCYERIEKSVKEWPKWLRKINSTNNWQHKGSPIVWKELLMRGSKPIYIGGASKFLEYVNFYYGFDLFMGNNKYNTLLSNLNQFKKNKSEDNVKKKLTRTTTSDKTEYVICISALNRPFTKILISQLLEMSNENNKSISKIFVCEACCCCTCGDRICFENQCSPIDTKYSEEVVRSTQNIKHALPLSDVLIVLDHVPFEPKMSIGEWLYANMQLMQNLANSINASASASLYIVLANVGPACFNATVLMHSSKVRRQNIVVASSDLGLQVLESISEVCEVPTRKIYCPPVWGFTGINHLVDVKTTIHRYDSFHPYNRYTKVNNSTLTIGCLTPEIRTLEYLTVFDENIWVHLAEKLKVIPPDVILINKAIAVVNLIKVWLIEPINDCIVSLGIICDGSFDLTFDGAFSQPAYLTECNEWRPAKEYFMPRDNFVKLPYLQYIAKTMMTIENTALPPINKYVPCICTRKYGRKKLAR